MIITETTEQLIITAKFEQVSLFSTTFIVNLIFKGGESIKYSDFTFKVYTPASEYFTCVV